MTHYPAKPDVSQVSNPFDCQ